MALPKEYNPRLGTDTSPPINSGYFSLPSTRFDTGPLRKPPDETKQERKAKKRNNRGPILIVDLDPFQSVRIDYFPLPQKKIDPMKSAPEFEHLDSAMAAPKIMEEKIEVVLTNKQAA